MVILSDIQGLEDFLGDMDFKVCGTEKGITALQMDNKAKGLSVDILARALKQAREGRAFILDAMLADHRRAARAAARHRPAHRDHSHPRGQDPRRHRVRRQGGPRHPGRDGRVRSTSRKTAPSTSPPCEGPAGEAAKAMILGIVKEPEVGEEFDGEVVGIKDFGAFVKLTPGKDGLLHISRVANGRVGKVEDVLALGDVVKVKVLEVDPNSGKISARPLGQAGRPRRVRACPQRALRPPAPRRPRQPSGPRQPQQQRERRRQRRPHPASPPRRLGTVTEGRASGPPSFGVREAASGQSAGACRRAERAAGVRLLAPDGRQKPGRMPTAGGRETLPPPVPRPAAWLRRRCR